MRFHVGTYTRHGGPGICEVRWDGISATVRVVAETPDPSFLALHPAGHTLYAVNEQPEGAVSAFALDPSTGDLRPLGTTATGGAAPCHLAIHPSGRWLAVCNYRGASIAVFGIRVDGSLGPRTDLTPHRGHSIHPVRQRQPHPHGVYWREQGKQLWVPDLGTDSIIVHTFDPGTGTLGAPRARVGLPAGSGPRHLAFSSAARVVYCLNELHSTLITLVPGRADGDWRHQHAQSTLPTGFAGVSAAAEISLHHNGRWLYCSNRGHDSVAVFDCSKDPARPRLAGHFPSGGRTPRHFTLTADHHGLVVANQESNTVAIHSIGPSNPPAFALSATTAVHAPACVLMTGNQTC